MAALIQYHGDGVETELVRLEYTEICAAIELDKSRCLLLVISDKETNSF